jgi:hypothetical protein
LHYSSGPGFAAPVSTTILLGSSLSILINPSVCTEPLAIELKLALDRWCKGDPRAISATPSFDKFSDSGDTSGQVDTSIAAGTTGATDRTVKRSKSLTTAGTDPAHDEGSAKEAKHSSAAKGFASFLNRIVPGRKSLLRHKEKNKNNQSNSWHQSMPQIAEESPGADAVPSADGTHRATTPASTMLPTVSSANKTSARTLRTKSQSSNNMDLTGPSSPNSKRTAGGILHVDTRPPGRSLPGKERAWPYHVVMHVVTEMQRDHCAPIIVFI